MAQQDAGALEELELQPEAQAPRAFLPLARPLQAEQQGVALLESEAQQEAASVLPRVAQLQASLE